MNKKIISSLAALLLCLGVSACQQSEPPIIFDSEVSDTVYITSVRETTAYTEETSQTAAAKPAAPTESLTEKITSEDVSRTAAETEQQTPPSAADAPVTAGQEEKPPAEWLETEYSAVLYVNTDGIYSRTAAIQGSPTVRRYGLNQAVRVIAYTDTDYYKLAEGEFIHKAYLDFDRIPVSLTSEKPAATASPPTAAATPSAAPAPAITTAAPVTTTEKAVDDFIGRYNMRRQEQWEIDFANKVFELTNAEREKNGKPAYKRMSPLDKVANIRTWEILVDYRSDHSRPDGQFFSSAYKEQGIAYHYCGENIAAGQRTPEEVVSAWMNSPHHRDNILSEEFTYMAAGMYYKDGDGYGYYWCQEFCSLFE